jgi:hypothetical protein
MFFLLRQNPIPEMRIWARHTEDRFKTSIQHKRSQIVPIDVYQTRKPKLIHKDGLCTKTLRFLSGANPGTTTHCRNPVVTWEDAVVQA